MLKIKSEVHKIVFQPYTSDVEVELEALKIDEDNIFSDGVNMFVDVKKYGNIQGIDANAFNKFIELKRKHRLSNLYYISLISKDIL